MSSYRTDQFFTLREFSMVENQEKSNVVTPWSHRQVTNKAKPDLQNAKISFFTYLISDFHC